MKTLKLTVELASLAEVAQMRADQYICENCDDLTRSQLKNRLQKLTINGKEAKLSAKLRDADQLEIEYSEPEKTDLEAEDIFLDILYEDEHTIVINKPQGMVVHPAAGNYSGTVVNALLSHCAGMKDTFGDDQRPGIVHRLDKDTSGVLLAAKDVKALEYYSAQFKDRTTEKTYFAIVKKTMKKRDGEIDTFIARDPENRKRFTVTENSGKRAITVYHTEKNYSNYACVKLTPKTGRTHQLRVHMAHLGNPIIGDPIYTRRDKDYPEATLMLHAASLKIKLFGKEEEIQFDAPIPDRFNAFLKK